MRRLWEPVFGCGLIGDGIDMVVVDVDDIVIAEELFPLVRAHVHHVFEGDDLAAIALPPFGEQLAACSKTAAFLAVGKNQRPIALEGKRLVRQQCGHAELGVAGQRPDDRAQFGIKAVELADLPQGFFRHLIAKGVRDNDHDLLVLAPVGRGLFAIEVELTLIARNIPPFETAHLILPGVIHGEHE